MARITWQMVFDDFQKRHPNLSREVEQYFPYGFLTILLVGKSGSRMVYDYISKQVRWMDKQI